MVLHGVSCPNGLGAEVLWILWLTPYLGLVCACSRRFVLQCCRFLHGTPPAPAWREFNRSGASCPHLQVVLSNVTAGLRPGRMTAIMGPSGAGKTSLMTTLAGEALGST
jgi:hypothetical protein